MSANGLLLERLPAPLERTPFLRRLLVATDGCADEDRAVSYAVALAARSGGKITFCYSIDRTDALSAAPGGAREGERVMERALGMASEAGVAATSTLLEGDRTDAILACVREQTCDAIVIAAQRRHWAERMFRGSATDGVLRQSRVPVFVVPPGPIETLHSKRILVAVDDSSPSDGAVAFAIDLASMESASMVFCTISEAAAIVDRAEYYGTDLDATLTELHAAANDLVAHASLRAAAREVPSTGAVRSGEPAEQILRLALARQADLIVAGTHGRRGIRRFVLGSVAERVVRGSNVPVVIVRL